MSSAVVASIQISFLTGCLLVVLLLTIGAFGALLIRSMLSGAHRAHAAKKPPPTKHVDAWALSGSRFSVDPRQGAEFPNGFPDSGDSDSPGSNDGRGGNLWDELREPDGDSRDHGHDSGGGGDTGDGGNSGGGGGRD